MGESGKTPVSTPPSFFTGLAAPGDSRPLPPSLPWPAAPSSAAAAAPMPCCTLQWRLLLLLLWRARSLSPHRFQGIAIHVPNLQLPAAQGDARSSPPGRCKFARRLAKLCIPPPPPPPPTVQFPGLVFLFLYLSLHALLRSAQAAHLSFFTCRRSCPLVILAGGKNAEESVSLNARESEAAAGASGEGREGK